MMTPEEMRAKPVIIHPAEEGGFVAEVEDLPGCMTQGDTMAEVVRNIEEAKELYIETEMKRRQEKTVPEKISEQYDPDSRWDAYILRHALITIAEADPHEERFRDNDEYAVFVKRIVMEALRGNYVKLEHVHNTERSDKY